MAEGLTKKKWIRAGHKTSATRTLAKADGALAAKTADEAKLSQLKLTLEENLGTLKLLDDDIVELIEEGALATEIEQPDIFRGEIYAPLARINKVLKRTMLTSPSTPTVAAYEATPTRATGLVYIRLPKLSIKPFNVDITQ